MYKRQVEERKVSVAEIIAGAKNGTLTEAFDVGTAATVTKIGEIGFEGELYKLSDPITRTISTSIAKELNDIRSVSYTHLDVYKRQHQTYSKIKLCQSGKDWQSRSIPTLTIFLS